MRRINIIISICCAHFRDKADFLLELGSELVRQGHEVRLTLAGRQACSHIIRVDRDLGQCLHAHEGFFSRLVDEYPHLNPGRVGSERDLEVAVERAWLSRAGEPPEQREFDGYLLDEICRASVARQFMVSADALAKVARHERKLAQDAFHKDAIRHLIYYRRMFTTWQPDVVVYFGGFFHQDRTAFLAAVEAGVRSVAIEGSFVPGMIWWDESGITGSRGTPACGATGHLQDVLCPSTAQVARINQLFMRSMNCPVDWRTVQQTERIRLRATLKVPDVQRLVLFLGQVPYDASLVTGGGDFQNQAVALDRLALAVRHIGKSLIVVRPHPKDDTNHWQSRSVHGVPIFVVHGASSSSSDGENLYSTLSAADLVATVNSQSGLQAAWCGLPVLVLGRAFYSGRGFTVDAYGHERYTESSVGYATRSPVDRDLIHRSLMSYMAAIEGHCLVPGTQVCDAVARLVRPIRHPRHAERAC